MSLKWSWKSGALVVAGGAVSIALALSFRAFIGEYRDVRPPRTPVVRPPAEPLLAAMQDVSFATKDGLTLRGWYIPSKNRRAVLLAHGYRGNRASMLPDARILAARGYGVLLFDLRAHGESDGDKTTYGDEERRDVSAAVDLLSSEPDVNGDQIGALGFSAGSSAVAMDAAEDPRIRAIVLEGATTSMKDACIDDGGRFSWFTFVPALLGMSLAGVNVGSVQNADAASKFAPRPLLVVHGESDPAISPKRAKTIFDADTGPKRLWLIPGAGHGGYIEAAPREYPEAVVSFFDAALAKPGS
ncbi:MAG TPA: alpha/beta fold hydrolase [Polyangiaceae bacterium]|nr:alpha/beta fold hydrolase [Polyangiaceae bacterium]